MISGSRRSGKSILAVNIISRLLNEFDYHFIVLISETGHIDVNGSYKNIVDKKMIFTSDKMDEILTKIIKY